VSCLQYERAYERMLNENEIVQWLHDNKHYIGFHVDSHPSIASELDEMLEENLQLIGGKHHG